MPVVLVRVAAEATDTTSTTREGDLRLYPTGSQGRTLTIVNTAQDDPAAPSLDETQFLLKRMVCYRMASWFTPPEQTRYEQLVALESSLLAASH